MKKIYLSVALALGVIASCQKVENVAEVNQPVFETMTAALGDVAETRTQGSANYAADGTSVTGYDVVWSKGDSYILFAEDFAYHKYVLKDGYDGEIVGKFSYAGSGDVTNSIEGAAGLPSNVFVALYPYSEETVAVSTENGYRVNTVIPAQQVYAENSFGVGSAPMVAINHGLAPVLTFKNVCSFFSFPVKASTEKVVIASVALESSNGNPIAGNITVDLSAEDGSVPENLTFTEGASKIEVFCSKGVELSTTEATRFVFALAPGTYDDLVLTFTDVEGNYWTVELGAKLKNQPFTRSRAVIINSPLTLAEKPTATKPIDLVIKAQATAYMDGDRIVPSLSETNFIDWILKLAEAEDPKGLIQEAIYYIGLKNYGAAYEILGGVPGFVKQVERFQETGVVWQMVDYNGTDYIVSMLKDIEKINDIQSLLNYLKEFEMLYEASGLSNTLTESLFNFETLINNFIDQYFVATDTSYADSMISALEETISECNTGISIVEFYISTDFTGWGKYEEKYRPLVNSLQDYVTAAEALIAEIENHPLWTSAKIDAKVDALPEIQIETSLLKALNSGLALIGRDPIKIQINPAKTKAAANEAYNTVIATAKPALKSTLTTAFDSLADLSLIEILEKTVNDPTSVTSKFLTYVFQQESFINSIKTVLHEAVSAIEEQSRNDIAASNVSLKEQAIAVATTTALLNARIDAINKVNASFEKKNQAEIDALYEGPWGIFQKLLNWNKVVEQFVKYDLMDVYGALVELGEAVEDMITYEKVNYSKGTYLYTVENISDYEKDVDYWIIPLSESFE